MKHLTCVIISVIIFLLTPSLHVFANKHAFTGIGKSVIESYLDEDFSWEEQALLLLIEAGATDEKAITFFDKILSRDTNWALNVLDDSSFLDLEASVALLILSSEHNELGHLDFSRLNYYNIPVNLYDHRKFWALSRVSTLIKNQSKLSLNQFAREFFEDEPNEETLDLVRTRLIDAVVDLDGLYVELVLPFYLYYNDDPDLIITLWETAMETYKNNIETFQDVNIDTLDAIHSNLIIGLMRATFYIDNSSKSFLITCQYIESFFDEDLLIADPYLSNTYHSYLIHHSKSEQIQELIIYIVLSEESANLSRRNIFVHYIELDILAPSRREFFQNRLSALYNENKYFVESLRKKLR